MLQPVERERIPRRRVAVRPDDQRHVVAPRRERMARLHRLDAVGALQGESLAELREALATTAALSTLWLEIDRLGLTVKKRSTPTNNAGPTSPLSVGGGVSGSRSTMSASMSFLMNAA